MLAVGAGAMAVLASPAIALLSTLGAMGGGTVGSYAGGMLFGEGSDGQKWGMLAGMGIAAVKIEGRQRSPAYVDQVTRVWRAALDAQIGGEFVVQAQWRRALSALSEGSQTTLGAYHRAWQ